MDFRRDMKCGMTYFHKIFKLLFLLDFAAVAKCSLLLWSEQSCSFLHELGKETVLFITTM